MKFRNMLIVHHGDSSSGELNRIKKVLKNHKINTVFLKRGELDYNAFRGIDLAVSLGGDGTFLRASHFNKNTPQLGINSAPEKKEGFFAKATINSFNSCIKKILNNNFKITKLARLRAKINEVPVKELCLNEFYIGPKKPYDLFNYELIINGKREFQRSSGLLIGAAAGSYAWIKSAGGEELPLESKEIQIIVREPYTGRLNKEPSIVKKIFSEKTIIRIKCKSYFGILVADSVSNEYEFNENDVIEISASKLPLKMIEI
ncbi:NAD(+)/NADH kinase [Candidatus Woesearchaeota archaeon]|nr:NAD(+)/NADH kinase [Candidatus Woesearchaeota archaeon]